MKDHNGETGRGRKTCKFFKELDSILGHRPASVPAALLNTGTGSSTVEDCTEETNNDVHFSFDVSHLLRLSTEGDDVQAKSPI